VVVIDDIKQFYRGHVALNQPLAQYTTYRIGGPADFFFEPVDKNDAIALVQYLHSHAVPFFVLGNGSNLLVNDTGVRGVVINLEHGVDQIRFDGEMIYAEAGARLTRLVDFCIQHDRQGLEMLSGIPGTVGGGIIMNAGAYGGQISDFLVRVEFLRDGHLHSISKEEAGFTYRHSPFERELVLSAWFLLPEGKKAELMKRRRELLIKRNTAQPLNFPNSGSVFKNPEGHHAAKLIEQAGLKGTRHGKAQISEKHGNFIVNTGGASAADILELMKLIRTTIRRQFGITLELEVRLVGFTDTMKEELRD